jgi:hypothetical protein
MRRNARNHANPNAENFNLLKMRPSMTTPANYPWDGLDGQKFCLTS